MIKRLFSIIVIVQLTVCFCISGCSRDPESSSSQREVVIYCALDQIFSEPLLKQFEKQTGIKVVAVYDVEASKTIGLVNRIIAEKENPRADVFWNNEILQTLVLQEKGCLAPYHSPSAKSIPSYWCDPDGYWTGFAARARVIIYNTDLIQNEANAPDSLEDFVDPQNRGKAAVANPLFGTTSTHATALFEYMGPEEAKNFFRAMKENEVAILAGNATVRDLVAQGEYQFGLTDTDDAVGALLSDKPVKMIFPDQDGDGTLLIPNSVALIKGAPHVEEAHALINFILSSEVEEALAAGRSSQIPLREGLTAPRFIPPVEDLVFMKISFAQLLPLREPSARFIHEEFTVKK